MSAADPIDRLFFAGLDENYPGSKRKRRTPPAPVEARQGLEGWDSRPFIKVIRGREMEMFTMGALAAALNRPLVTVRLWTRKGYIPQAPFRLPSRTVNGREQKGRRLYTRPLIEAAVEAFGKRGLLESPRIEWSQHTDLSIELSETWTRLHDSL